MSPPKGHFIQIDGIDGSGKSTLLGAARAWTEARRLKLFDTVEWTAHKKTLPTLEDIGDADVILTAEPTHAGIGWAIREEIIQKDRAYEAEYAAHAFALDRGVQYRRLILPFLNGREGRWVFQDRGLLSSLAYQPLQYELDKRGAEVTVDWLLTLPGNKIALERVPDAFVFVDIDPKIALNRLAQRTDKLDGHVFEASDFQIALAERYKLPEVTAPLRDRGTRIVTIQGDNTRENVAAEITKILNELAGG
jgi:thymidylate kinase